MTTPPTLGRPVTGGRLHPLTVRTRLTLVAAVSITALLGFVVADAWADWQQHTNLKNDSATGELGGQASLPLFVGAQQERRLTAAYLARPTAAGKKVLAQQRAATDKGVASFRHLSGTELETGQRHKWEYVERVYRKLNGLQETRRAADAHATSGDEVTGYYTGLLRDMIEFYQALSAMDDAQLTAETRPLVGLFWASEGLSQEDALLAQARAAGGMSVEHRREFADAYGSQRVMYERWIAPYLPAKDQATYEKITHGRAWKTKQRIEQQVISAPSADGAIEQLPSSVQQWDRAYGQVAQQIAALNLSRTQGLLGHGYQRAEEIRTEVFVKVGTSLAIVAALAVLIVGLNRSVTSRLSALRGSAEETARRLPAVVQRLQEGEDVDAQAEFPHPVARGDEFAAVEQALTDAQHTAVRMARAQAADRRGFAGFVARTGARALNLVGLQLDRLAGLQAKYGQRSEDAPVLQDLITVDHPGVAVRRHLDNLQTLAGGHEQPYTTPRSLADVIHDAAAETAAPERVTNKVRQQVWLRPQAVLDVMHVVASLLDNALAFSRGQVTITSLSPVHGVALHIEDMGTGMAPQEYDQANAKLADPPTFEAMAHHDGRLGLFVVGHLATLHGLRVSLRPSDYGGTTAVIMLPHSVQCPEPAHPDTAAPQPSPSPAPPAQAAPRPTRPAPEPRRAAPQPAPPAPAPAPAPAPVPPQPEAPGPERAAAGGVVETDPSAPALPRRQPQTHLAPQLARPAAPPPAVDPAADVDPATVGANWGAWQATSTEHAPTTEHVEPKDANR